MTALVILRIFAIVLESCDGPNQYDGRAINRARYQFLLTKDQYYELYLGCMIPLAIDAVARMVMLAYVLFDENSLELLQELSADHFGILLYVSDIISEIPFLATVVYVEPNDVHLDKPGIIIMTLLELFISKY